MIQPALHWRTRLTAARTRALRPAVVDQHVVVSTHGSAEEAARLYLLDRTTGAEKWSLASEAPGYANLVGANTHTVVWWRKPYGVSAHELATGKELWQCPGGFPARSSWPGLFVVVGIDEADPSSMRLTSLEAQSGKTIWEQACPKWVWPLIGNDELILCAEGPEGESSILQARSAADGRLRWAIDVSLRSDVGLGRRDIALASMDDTHAYCSVGGNVVAVRLATGACAWRVAPTPATMALTAPQGNRLVGLAGRAFVSLNCTTGALERIIRDAAERALHSQPDVFCNDLVFGESGAIVGIDVETGQRSWRMPLGEHVAIPRAADGELFVPVDDEIVCFRRSDVPPI